MTDGSYSIRTINHATVVMVGEGRKFVDSILCGVVLANCAGETLKNTMHAIN